MEQFCIYLWAISENIRNFMLIVGLIPLIIAPFLFPLLYECTDMDFEKIVPIFIKTLVSGIVLVLLAMLIPSKQDLALMFMFPYVKQGTETVIKSETMNKMKQMTNLYLDEQIRNLSKGNKR